MNDGCRQVEQVCHLFTGNKLLLLLAKQHLACPVMRGIRYFDVLVDVHGLKIEVILSTHFWLHPLAVQMQISARSLMPPPRPMIPSTSRGNSCTPINTSNDRNATYLNDRGFSSSQTGQSSNISSNSEASRRQRKRRPKKKN